MKKLWPYIIASVFAAFFFIGMWSYLRFVPVVKQEEGIIYYLKPGITKKLLVADLAHRKIIDYPTWLSIFVHLHKPDQLKTGEYLFPKGSTSLSIWQQMTSGTGLYFRHFTIIPGWSFNQLRFELLQQSMLKHTIAGLNDKQIIEYLGEERITPEGLFYPETYSYTRGKSDLSILKQAYDLMQRKLDIAWQNRAPDLPYNNKYEALIAASLIEKEAYFHVERPVIAGVLINRLNNNMLLQFDPSVIYGLGQHFDGKIHKRNLSQESVYNTYLHKGLPPTPIAIPSLLSIEAALHPEKHEYLYFVAKGDGTHQFSKNLLEHNKAVNDSLKNHWYFNENIVRFYIYQTLNKISAPIMRIRELPSHTDHTSFHKIRWKHISCLSANRKQSMCLSQLVKLIKAPSRVDAREPGPL